MSAEENKAILLPALETGDTDPESIQVVFDPAARFPDLAAYGLPPTLQGWKQFTVLTHTAFTDVHTQVEEIVAEGDTVMVWGIVHANHTRPWRSIPATNKRISFRFVTCYHFAQGKVVESRMLMDSLGVLQQMGAIPSSG